MPGHRMSPLELRRAWSAVLGLLKLEVSRPSFETWFEGTVPLALEEGVLTIAASAHSWLNERMTIVVERAVAEVFSAELAVQFVGEPGEREAPAAFAAWTPPGGVTPSTRLVGSLNIAYTFSRYLAYHGNCLALTTCRALVDGAGLRMSPVVIYGPPGMGKTHLLHAVAARALDQAWSVACLNAEEFTNRFQSALKKRTVDDFQAAVRNVRLLIVDDLQYFANKRATIDEFVHTLDAVAIAGGAAVIASEENPIHLDLPDRLLSRLSAGLVARIEPFGRTERLAYVQQVAAEGNLNLPAWAAERIAGCDVPSVRVLQGAIHAAVALGQNGILDLQNLDAQLLRIALEAATPPHLDATAVLDAVAGHFGLEAGALAGRSRKGDVTRARALATALLRETGIGYAEIGKLLDGRDARTVQGLEGRGRELLEADPALRALAG